MVVEEPVQLAIWQSLNHYCYKDAVFLAERLFAEAPSDQTLFLLATSYYRSGFVKRAHALLNKHGTANAHCKYLMAKCCLDLRKYSDVEQLIIGASGTFFNAKFIENIVNDYGSFAGNVLQLLASVYRKSDQKSKAAECYKASLKANPFLWTSFQSLCEIGEKVDAQDYFKTSNADGKLGDAVLSPFSAKMPSLIQSKTSTFVSGNKSNLHYDSLSSENMDPSHGNCAPLMTSTVVSKPAPNQNQHSRSSMDNEMPQQSNQGNREHARSRVGRNLLGANASNSPLTPSFGVLPQDTPPVDGLASEFITPSPTILIDDKALKAPAKKRTNKKFEGRTTRSTFTALMAGPSKSSLSNSSSPSMMTPSPTTSIGSMGLRRSSRLFGSNSGGTNNAPKVVKKTTKVQFSESTKSNSGNQKVKVRKTSRSSPHPLTPATENIQPEPIQQETQSKTISKENRSELSAIYTSSDGLMQLLQELGKGFAALASYDCRKAADIFESLPPHQLKTCWVLQQIGTAYFEIAEYHLAEQKFAELRRLDKYHMDGMVVFSTLLWFLKKEGSLSSLALDLVELDRLSPEAWSAMGNCFSLQKEHDTAIKFLQRAIQVNPDFTYAYTLLGHEYVLTEELDKGMSCFRTSIRLNSRHYNAWYGIAMVYYKQENYSLAEKHFLRALEINPRSSVLLCHLAVTQNAMKKPLEALQTVNKALSLMPKNALCKYHKSSFLYTLERYDDALNELEELRRIVPREALVYFLLGKIYRKRGQPHLAQMNFSWAMSLDPQGANSMIKEARYTEEDGDSSRDLDISDPIVNDLDEVMSDLEAQEESGFNDSSNSSLL